MTPRRARILVVPYDSGHCDFRMGAGPRRLIACGLAGQIRRAGVNVAVEEIHPEGPEPHGEIAAAFSIAKILSERVRAASNAGAFPLVLAGNCNSSLGTVSGLEPDSRGVVWLDAHGDFNTPETTVGGFLDGMALATLTGRCWTALSAEIPGFVPVPESHVLQLGARELDRSEAEQLAASLVKRAPADASDEEVESLLALLSHQVKGLYIHLDLDALDSGEGRANAYASRGGYSRVALDKLLERVGRSIPVKAMGVTAYDPTADVDGRVAKAAIGFVEAVLRELRT